MVVEPATTTASNVNQTLTHPVCFVGGGPGAADLLTLRAAERIRQADVLIWTDSLVCPQITSLAPDHCERIRTSTLTLEEVIPLLIDRQRQGAKVVRLHDGDTALYSAINEQICALNDADIPVEVVPGVSRRADSSNHGSHADFTANV